MSIANIIRNAINFYLENNLDNYPLLKEATLLGQSPCLKRIIEDSMKQIKQGNTRPVSEFLDELPD